MMWEHFWNEWVPMVTKGEDYVIVHNGDIIDGVHHNSTTQISHNLDDQRNIAIQVLKPIVNKPKCKGYYQIRGTEAHVGQSAENEEAIAKALGAIQDEGGRYSRWEMWLTFGKAKILVHFTHHIGTTNSAAYESTAVHKELIESYTEAGRWKHDHPDVLVRSHRHRFYKVELAARNENAISVVTAGWQLKTPFSYRLTMVRSSLLRIGG